MKVTFYKSAGVLIESGGSRLLCDPWLEDGAYYGAWAHVPPCDVTPEEIGRLDGIYITHIHPDHLHESSLAKFDRSITVFIHRYAFPYLRDAIVRLGFQVCELANGESLPLPDGQASSGTGLSLTIFAADNCDPSVCGQFFGCDARVGAERPGSTQVDSLAVIADDEHIVVNVNDCPFELARHAAPRILDQFGRPDLLLVNYVGAGPFPQCMVMPEAEKLEAADRKREQFLDQARRYVDLFQPKAFMPFAGTYTLAGSLAHLNRFRGVPTMKEAAQELALRCASRVVYLDTRQSYNCATGEVVGDGNPWTEQDIDEYACWHLVGRKMDYEADEPTPLYRIKSLLQQAGERFMKRCQEVNYRSDTRVYIAADDYTCYRLPTPSTYGRFLRLDHARQTAPHVILSCDQRMLVRLLTGRAHWQDASIGSHITFERRPDVFDRALEFCLNELYA